jgi:phosphotransferase system HPr (HPr) family protein
VSLALGFDCDLRIRHGDLDVNGKSILELMTLNAGPDAELDLWAKGEGAKDLLAQLGDLFESGFGERS